jgi:DNA-binding IclR family transcriptional regulator
MRHKTIGKTSIEKALDILLAFTPGNKSMGTMELGRKLGLHPATVNRIIQILAKKDFLKQDEKTKKFSLGASAFLLGRTIFQSVSNNLMHIAIPYLEDLCEKLGETVVLEVMSGKNSVVAYVQQGRRGLAIGPKVGDILPNHAAAGAKAILAYLNPEVIENFIDKEMPRLTSKTITKKEVLLRELKKAKRDGVAFCREEMEMGFNAIGAPIFNYDKRPVAAVVVAGLTHRVKCDVKSPIVIELKNIATRISEDLFAYEPKANKINGKKLSGS